METKKIICPNCKGILEVTNPKGLPTLLFPCSNPACGARLRVDFQTGLTVLAAAEKGDDKIGYLSLAGDRYALSEGINTIGRKASSSTATLQVETDDHSMSRLHAQIRVVRLKSGRVKAILTDLRSEDKQRQLPTTIEDEPLLPGDAFVLANGDALTLGRTKLTYKK